MLGNLEVMNFPFVFGGTSAFNEAANRSSTEDKPVVSGI